MIITVLKSSFIKSKDKSTYYRDYKKFSHKLFRADLVLGLDHTRYTFEDTFMKTLHRHAINKKICLSWEVYFMKKMTKTLLKLQTCYYLAYFV